MMLMAALYRSWRCQQDNVASMCMSSLFSNRFHTYTCAVLSHLDKKSLTVQYFKFSDIREYRLCISLDLNTEQLLNISRLVIANNYLSKLDSPKKKHFVKRFQPFFSLAGLTPFVFLVITVFQDNQVTFPIAAHIFQRSTIGNLTVINVICSEHTDKSRSSSCNTLFFFT